jgi:hypothetical protein
LHPLRPSSAGLGFLGHGNSSGSPFHNQPEIAVSGLSHSSHCVRTQHFAISDRRRRPPETGIMKGAAQKKIAARTRGLGAMMVLL